MTRLEKIDSTLANASFLKSANPDVIEKFRNEKQYLENMNITETGLVKDSVYANRVNYKGISPDYLYYRQIKTGENMYELSFYSEYPDLE